MPGAMSTSDSMEPNIFNPTKYGWCPSLVMVRVKDPKLRAQWAISLVAIND